MISFFQADPNLLKHLDEQMAKLEDILDGDDQCHLCSKNLTVSIKTLKSNWDYYHIDKVSAKDCTCGVWWSKGICDKCVWHKKNAQKLCYECLNKALEIANKKKEGE